MTSAAAIGTPAPDFALPGGELRDGRFERATYRLSEQQGSPVVLAFYPGDQSKVCTAQLCSYQSELAQFRDLGATLWGISRQDVDSHEAFAAADNLEFPLLADTDGHVVESYGVGLPGLGLRRSIFIIDAEGIIRWKHVALVGATFRSVDTIRNQLEALTA